MTVKEIVSIACAALDEKKGADIVTINVEGKTIVCDYFVICSGSNPPQVRALCDNVTEKLEKNGIDCRSREGYSEGRWIALDFSDVVIHIFSDETRLFYHLERLWETGDNMQRYVPEPKETAEKKKTTLKTAGEGENKPAVKKAKAKITEDKAKETTKPAKKPRAKKAEDENVQTEGTQIVKEKKPRAKKAAEK